MTVPLWSLPSGAGFAVPGTSLRGRLIEADPESHAKVEFVAGDGRPQTQFWSPGTEVVPAAEAGSAFDQARQREKAATWERLAAIRRDRKPVPYQPSPVQEQTMSATKTKTTKKNPRAAKPTANGKGLSMLDAAAKLLGGRKQPMKCKEMIEVMAERGLWTSPGGKTPEATLYAAIITEIAKKGKESRFRKVDKGLFTASANGK